jgi:streptomycin 6-kinase
MPRNLVAAALREDGPRRAWMKRLPDAIRYLTKQWSLEVGEPYQPGGQTAWVAPARTDARGGLVLKVGWRHNEAIHEADALREWNGEGAVHLHAVEEFDDTIALLIEQCVPGRVLATRAQSEQDLVIAGLLQRLWRDPAIGHPFRPLQALCDAWADEFEEKVAREPTIIDPGLARAGMELFRALPGTAPRNVLLCTDLHAENVLAAEREPWLVIDPKPYIGDPTYDLLQHLLNCPERLFTDPVGIARRMADLVDLDGDRVLLWLFARCVQETPDAPGLAHVARQIAPA